jgi:hypothetical protein
MQTAALLKSLRPNLSLDPTRNGIPLQAVISFSAFRVLPLRSAQLAR